MHPERPQEQLAAEKDLTWSGGEKRSSLGPRGAKGTISTSNRIMIYSKVELEIVIRDGSTRS